MEHGKGTREFWRELSGEPNPETDSKNDSLSTAADQDELHKITRTVLWHPAQQLYQLKKVV